jgi:hypothetical protein
MNRQLTFAMLAISTSLLIFSGCGSSDNDTTTPENSETNQTETNTTEMNATVRFESIMISGDTIERDNQTKLEWIGSIGTLSSACMPNMAADTEETEVEASKAHCENLTFAGHSDWRVPTSTENSDYIKAMQDAGITPYYLSSTCPRVIGVDNDTSAQAVNTHNADPVGAITPWSTFLEKDITSFGVKCVRGF